MGEPSAMVTRVALTNVWGDSAASKTKKMLVAAGQRMPVRPLKIVDKVVTKGEIYRIRSYFGGTN